MREVGLSTDDEDTALRTTFDQIHEEAYWWAEQRGGRKLSSPIIGDVTLVARLVAVSTAADAVFDRRYLRRRRTRETYPGFV